MIVIVKKSLVTYYWSAGIVHIPWQAYNCFLLLFEGVLKQVPLYIPPDD
jgi:hypothetical protein